MKHLFNQLSLRLHSSPRGQIEDLIQAPQHPGEPSGDHLVARRSVAVETAMAEYNRIYQKRMKAEASHD